MSKIIVAEYIIKRLEREVDHAFCFVGGAAIFLMDELGKGKIKPVFCLHEQACSIAADAYGQYTNKLGLCIVTSGPGVLNALTGISAAFFDSTPMIILSGQANSNQLSCGNLRTKGIQEVKTEEIVKPITKAVFTIRNPTAAPDILEKAIRLATTGRKGPVWIDIPLDIQSTLIDIPQNYTFVKTYQSKIDVPDIRDKDIQNLLNMICFAKSPIIFVGNGVRLSHSEKLLKSVLEKLQIPVLTTWRAMDLFEEDHPLFVGRPGSVGQRGANTTLQTCDFLWCLGTRLDLASVAFNYRNFAPKAQKIIVDIDQAELDKLDFPATLIHEDLNNFLYKLNFTLNDFPQQRYENKEWLAKCKELHKQPIETIKPTGNVLSLYKFIEELTPYLEDKIVVVGSSGTISEVFCQSFKVPKGCRVIQSNGLGSMGFALPAAIGAYYASGKPIVCLDGDGSFAMNIQELSLVAGANLPINMFIINNGGYVSIKNTQNGLCNGFQIGVDARSGLYLPDYKYIANSYDLPYFKCTSQTRKENLEFYFKYFPCIIEVFTDPNHKTQCRTTTKKNAQGQPEASKLEELWP